jgi:hypothetical protein
VTEDRNDFDAWEREVRRVDPESQRAAEDRLRRAVTTRLIRSVLPDEWINRRGGQ